jgi:deoxyribodipyrimidine photo-lyase
MTAPVILWLRQDLRLSDQPALVAACHDGPVIPVYVLDDEAPGDHAIGGAGRWWLHHSLAALDEALREKGSRLILRRGQSAEVLAALARETGVTRIHAIHHYEPWWLEAEREIGAAVELFLHDGNQLAPPGSVTTGAGQPFKIYTPFWRALSEHMPPDHPVRAPTAIPHPARWPRSDALDAWALLPTRPDWATGFADWTPGEAGAHARLDQFVGEAAGYAETRNLPAQEGTSRLSPHLHWGEITPRQIWHRVAGEGGSVRTYLGELGWRDYAQSILIQYPDVGCANTREAFDRMPWRNDGHAKADLRAWQRGRTGYPIVDAGMRQLWTSGWMHNRVRMITASFLIKHLLIDWREGERWFWDCLVDADYGNNSINWQWTAGTGIDSQMFPRIMAPLTQSAKFDAAEYIREWVPELAGLSDETIHDPEDEGCRPVDYPEKLIGHREARERALAAYRVVKT